MNRSIFLLIGLVSFIAANAANQDLVHVRLKDRLDRPDDGYCFDILGTGDSLRVDLPLFAHNCKPVATPDSAVIYTSKGQLVFPAVDVCVTAFGVNNTVLPGTSVLLRPCDERAAFYVCGAIKTVLFLRLSSLMHALQTIMQIYY